MKATADGLGPDRAEPVGSATERPDAGSDELPRHAPEPVKTKGLSPAFLAYVVGPVALVVLVVLRHYGLVARVSLWAYAGAILGSALLRAAWSTGGPTRRPGTLRLHVRVALHVAAVTSVVYMSGWGPALGMAFAFSALADLQQTRRGARGGRRSDGR